MALPPLNVVGDVWGHRGDGWCKDRLIRKQLALCCVQPGVVQELCSSESPLWQVMEEGLQDVLGVLVQALPLLAAV